MDFQATNALQKYISNPKTLSNVSGSAAYSLSDASSIPKKIVLYLALT
jgi:hypothetical protein